MNLEEARRYLNRAGYEAVLAVVDAAVGSHWHDHGHSIRDGRAGPPVSSSGRNHTVHTAGYPARALPLAPEPPEALAGPDTPAEAPEATGGQREARKRPGRTPPPPEPLEVLDRIQEQTLAAGLVGYSPLSQDQAVAVMVTRLATAQAEARQWHESASHHRQIAEHYRDALAHLVGFTGGDDRSRAALADPPEWNGRLI